MLQRLFRRTAGGSPRVALFRVLTTCLVFASVAPPLFAAPPGPDQFAGTVLGNPPSSGSFAVSNGTVQIQAQGVGLGGRGDQGYFAYSALGTNDFDIRVRATALDGTSLTARAGLMVRASTNHSVEMAAIVVTPGMNGVQFVSRNSPDSVTTATGSFPGNLPNAWLRLQRSNDLVRGFASVDGRNWSQMGRATLALTNALVGLAASSAVSNAPATATFADWADSTGASEDPLPLTVEPPGPSSRRTALAITEIHYNPPESPGAGELPYQFVEVFNSDFTAKELGGHRLEAGGLIFVFPADVVLPPGGYLVVAQNPSVLRSRHPDLPATRTLGPWEGGLDRHTDTVNLWSPFGALLLEIPYSDEEPWPLAADGEGHSMVLARPSWGEAEPQAWAASAHPDGSPGRADPIDADPRTALRITEVFGRRGSPIPPFLEIFNSGVQPAPLAGVIVSPPGDYSFSAIPLPDRAMAPGERITVEVPPSFDVMPFYLFLRDKPGGKILDAVSLGALNATDPMGRRRLDRPELRRLTTPTPGAANAPARRPRLVISEVMYKPITARDDDQFLEIWNPGSEPVLLTGWRLTGGVEFNFPDGRSLAPGERGVVARNSARLRLTYPGLSAGQILGEFGGRLAAQGERLTLRDETGAVEFGFTYRTGGEWPSLADGGGSSLELLHPDLDPDLGSSWAASDETRRASWQTHEITGVLEGGSGGINDIRILLLGSGETLVDDVEVFAEGSTNLINNSAFETGTVGWNLGGTHERSGVSTNEGFGGSAQSLHLRAAGRGDNGINSARAAIRPGLRPGTNTTLRFRARWLAGSRDLLMRVKGNFLELPVRLDVPEDLGTPARANSRSLSSPRPALSDLSHFPILPAEDQPVRVTVRVAGDLGNVVPMLRYRLDPATEFADPRPMNDAGVDGDRVADDGLYTAVIPGGAARTMAAFHVTLGPEDTAFRLPRTTPGREALVRWGEAHPAGSLGIYRIWITRTTETRWSNRARLHNGDLEATFVYGGVRAMYGVGTLYSGSPFVSPGYNGPAGTTLCGYVLHFPDDDPLLGEKDMVMDWPIRDDTRQLEQRAYEFAADIGLPYLHRRFIHFYVNSSKRGAIYEDTQQPGSAYLRNWSPDDDDGSLLKIEDWFEFNAAGEREFNEDARLTDFRRSDGSRNTARYRWSFRPRSVQESAHDFSALYRLVDAAVAPPQLLEYQRELEREMDFDAWAGVFAVEHAVGNWDSFGYGRGKNMYAYRPERGPWRLYMWDIDFVMSAGGEGPGNWPFATIDPTISVLYQYPSFQRAYWRAIKKLVNGPMSTERFQERTEAVRLGLLENGVNAAPLTSARNWIRNQRDSLLGQLADLDRPFTFETGLANGSTTDPVLRLQGQGPLEMTGLRVNGEIVPVAWFLPNQWYATLPLNAGRTQFAIQPVDSEGTGLGVVRALSANLTQPPLPESQRIVINEVHPSPRVEGAAFVELHNPSTTQTFDLSHLQLVGTGEFDFPANTVLAPGQFLTLGKSISGYQEEFGRSLFPTALLPWTLDPLGETVALIRPARGTNPAVTVTAVTYRPDGPWPTVTPGLSLQLRDAARGEDDRVGAWATYTPPTNASPWKEFSVTGPAAGTNLLLYVSSFPPSLTPNDLAGRWGGNLSAFGFDFAVEFSRSAAGTLRGQFFAGVTAPDPDLIGSELAEVSAAEDGTIRFTWIEIGGRFTGRIDASGRRATGSFSFEGGTSPFTLTRQYPSGTVLVDDLKLTRQGEDANLLRNGGFQSDLGTDWLAQGAHQDSLREDVSDPLQDALPNFALRLVGTRGGDGALTNAVIQSGLDVVPGTIYQLSGRYLPVQAQGLVIGLEGGPRFTADLRPRTNAGSDATPGRPNSVAESLAPVPLVWLNEVQPENTDGLLDNSGRAEPWVELHNSGVTPAPLDGYFLTDDPSVPAKWAFPTGSSVPANGFLIVWLDAEPAEGSPASPHATFRPTARNGVLVLNRPELGGFLSVDYLRYREVPAGMSYGHSPDAWVHADGILPRPTPGLSNHSSVEPEKVWINEWMALNDGQVRDPADLDADDWFELYNPGSSAVDLTGWFLTDTSANPTKFHIPSGYHVPAGGLLLVWADEEAGQNQAGRPDLHVNFRLSGDGEEIVLYRPDGTKMDQVVFGAQSAGRSQGRETDGAPGTDFAFFDTPSPGHSNHPPAEPGPAIVTVERRADGLLKVRFLAQPGARYRLRAKEDLNQSTWFPGTATITAEGASAELDWPADGAPQRFLQVERMP